MSPFSENALKFNQKQEASIPLSLQLTTIATCKEETDWKVKIKDQLQEK
jgi:hypothetical protein